MIAMDKSCPLCQASGRLFYEDKRHRFYSCPHCMGLFRDPAQLPDSAGEKERYLFHQNSLNDQGYLNFVDPLLEAVKKEMPRDAQALDYGCGHSPVISEVLNAEGFQFTLYDPFFYPDESSLARQYDLITCCEVVEHFHHPKREFNLLYDLLKPGGRLYCMTALYQDGVDFASWHYKNDLTHVFIYRDKTLQYIAQNMGFHRLDIRGRLIVLGR